MMDDIAKKKNDIGIIGILNRTENKNNDIAILKSQTRVELPIILAGTEFNYNWDELIRKYRESAFNNIIVMIDRKGNILKSFDDSCRCYGQIIDYFKSMNILSE